MTTTKELLQTLNALRTANGKTELAGWKSSREKLEAAISELQPAAEVVSEPVQQPAASDLTDVEGQTEPTDLTSDEPVVQSFEVGPATGPCADLAVIQKSPRGAIGALVIELLGTEMPYEDIVKQVRETYPDARTTARSIASVAMDLRRDGVNVPSRRKPAKAPLHVRIAETNQHEEG